MAPVLQVRPALRCLALALLATPVAMAGPPEITPAQAPAAAPDAHRIHCRPAGEAPCVLTLHGAETVGASASCSDEAWRPHLSFQQPKPVMDRNGDGWGESVIQLDMDPDRGCQCALFRLHLGAGLNGFAFHLGDSASNDGYGGDAGTDPIHYAEAHIKIDPAGPLLAVHSASGEVLGPDPLLKMPLPDLGGHFMDVEVCHETLEFSLDGDPGGVGSVQLQSLHGRELLAVAGRRRGAGSTASPTMDPWIYAAFNRVVHQRDGAPSHDRFGRGVERVEIRLSP